MVTVGLELAEHRGGLVAQLPVLLVQDADAFLRSKQSLPQRCARGALGHAGCRASGVVGVGVDICDSGGRVGYRGRLGHGWSHHGLDGTAPVPGSCHIRIAADGEPLPDPTCTPGAVDAAVTDTNIASTVCRKGGYTSSVRPPESLTEPTKRQLMAAYDIPASKIGDYELDHFIALNDGGASDVRNLWPEPNTTSLYRPSGQNRSRHLLRSARSRGDLVGCGRWWGSVKSSSV